MPVTSPFLSVLYFLLFAQTILSAFTEWDESLYINSLDLLKRAPSPLPSVTVCKAHFDTAKDTSPLLLGMRWLKYAQKVKEWAKKNNPAYMILGEHWKDEKRWQYDPGISQEPFDRASTAMAQLFAGTVYVMLPSGTTGSDWKTDAVWDRIE